MIVALTRIFPQGDKRVSHQAIIALHRLQCINQRTGRLWVQFTIRCVAGNANRRAK